LTVIFAENPVFSFLTLIYYATSLAEHIILKKSKGFSADLTARGQCLNFDESEVKLNYAKTKLILSIAVGILFALLSEIVIIVTWKTQLKDENTVLHQTKSLLLFVQIALLTILKDKHEKTVHRKDKQDF
jgi:NADH:ubiquinone oxidoreductase subunit 6 (subunit J)